MSELNGPISATIRRAAAEQFGGQTVDLSICGLCGELTPLRDGLGEIVEEKPCADCNRIRLIAPHLAEWVDRVVAFHVCRYHPESEDD